MGGQTELLLGKGKQGISRNHVWRVHGSNSNSAGGLVVRVDRLAGATLNASEMSHIN